MSAWDESVNMESRRKANRRKAMERRAAEPLPDTGVVELLHRLRAPVDQGGYDGYALDPLHIAAATEIKRLQSALDTAETMHAAWRKRAEEAERAPAATGVSGGEGAREARNELESAIYFAERHEAMVMLPMGTAKDLLAALAPNHQARDEWEWMKLARELEDIALAKSMRFNDDITLNEAAAVLRTIATPQPQPAVGSESVMDPEFLPIPQRKKKPAVLLDVERLAGVVEAIARHDEIAAQWSPQAVFLLNECQDLRTIAAALRTLKGG